MTTFQKWQKTLQRWKNCCQLQVIFSEVSFTVDPSEIYPHPVNVASIVSFPHNNGIQRVTNSEQFGVPPVTESQ